MNHIHKNRMERTIYKFFYTMFYNLGVSVNDVIFIYEIFIKLLKGRGIRER